MKIKLKNPNSKKTQFSSKWQQLAGLSLVFVGLILVQSFVKPYLYYLFAPVPQPTSHKIQDNRILIPSIKMIEPIGRDLDNAIVRFPSTAIPGQSGNVVLTGHNQAKDSLLFSLLYLVRQNDEVIIDYQGTRYTYRVKTKKIIRPARIDNFLKQNKDRRLTLITCYPPTSAAMRLIVIAQQTNS